jgi:hypothetical protein
MLLAARGLLTACPLLTRLFAPLLETCEKVDPSTGLSYTQWPSTIRVFSVFLRLPPLKSRTPPKPDSSDFYAIHSNLCPQTIGLQTRGCPTRCYQTLGAARYGKSSNCNVLGANVLGRRPGESDLVQRRSAHPQSQLLRLPPNLQNTRWLSDDQI